MAFFRKKKKRRQERKEPYLGVLPGSSAPKKQPRKAKREKKRRRSLIFTLLSWVMTLGLWGVIVMAATTAYVFFSLEKKGLFKIPEREPGMILLAEDGHVIAERGAFYGDEARIHEMPRYVPLAFVAIEDRRYYNHFGIDVIGLARAFYANYKAGRVVQGGSTITQQLAKNLFLKPERTYERKFQEAVLALWLENKFSKDEILQLYLNRVYFGAGAWGIEKAAQKFFGKSVTEVSISEAAILAAVLKAPSQLNPVHHPDRAAARANEVIADMIETGFITKEEALKALSVETKVKAADYVPATQYIVDWIEDQLPNLIGKFDQSIIVETTLNRNLQSLAEKSVRRRLSKDGKTHNVSQAAFVAMKPTGAVVAMVGGKSYRKSQFNRAVKAQRQPGSAFKPFVYLAAIEQGHGPNSTAVDGPVKIGKWRPENYNRKYYGEVTFKRALALSLNTVAAKVANEVGPESVTLTAQRLGIRSPLTTNASISLGTSEVNLLELTGAFSTFANGGRTIIPHVVTRISTRDGKILYKRFGDGFGQTVTEYDLGALNDMMRAVVTGGTGRRAAIKGHDIAGKTGTSQDYRDAWFIGYSSHLVAGVWMGNDDNSPTRRVTGGSLPALVWRDFMTPAHKDLAMLKLPGKKDPLFDDTIPMGDYEGGGGFFDILGTVFGDRRGGQEDPAATERRRITREQRRQRRKQRQEDLFDGK